MSTSALRRTAAVLALALAAAMTACSPPASTPAGPGATTLPAVPTKQVGPAGDPDPTALASFRCGPDSTGSWVATGTLTNAGTERADYVVTVLVAGPTNTSVPAKRRVIRLASGASAPVRFTALPLPIEGELTCQAQVVRRLPS